jgi:hypothetical protein
VIDGATVPIRYESRLKLIARDLVDHFEARLEALDGRR